MFACHLGGLLGKSWCWRDGGGKGRRKWHSPRRGSPRRVNFPGSFKKSGRRTGNRETSCADFRFPALHARRILTDSSGTGPRIFIKDEAVTHVVRWLRPGRRQQQQQHQRNNSTHSHLPAAARPRPMRSQCEAKPKPNEKAEGQ